MTFPFRDKDKRAGEALIASGGIKSVLFSEGTYQIEVASEGGVSFWPFLQVSEEGEPEGGFCTCENDGSSCPHLAAAFLFICKGEPLHVRFRSSLWHVLSFDAFTRSFIEPEGSLPVRAKTGVGRDFLRDYLFERQPETEENSIKFSGRSSEELALWKRGTPTRALQYELSFWSDLAKRFFIEQTFGRPYTIRFEGEKEMLPEGVEIACSDLLCRFSLKNIDWNKLIVALRDVACDLRVYDVKDVRIKKMSYDPDRKEIRIEKELLTDAKEQKAVVVGRWVFVHGVGFFPSETNRFIKEGTITADRIGAFLSENRSLAEKYLVDARIVPDALFLSQKPHFDEQGNLHISSYAFREGDLNEGGVGFFSPWLYLPEKGFVLVRNPDFDSLETMIPVEGVRHFVVAREELLNRYEGFVTHLSGVELRLTYRFDNKEGLSFAYESDFSVKGSEVIDFGDRIYVSGKGFYKKMHPKGFVKITPETQVVPSEIPYFIHSHREELEQVSSFFNASQPIASAGVRISLNDRGRITVRPEFTYMPGVEAEEVRFIGDFTYVEGGGFAEIPEAARLPEKYLRPLTIKPNEESGFVTVELRRLKQFITEIDERLIPADNLRLVITDLKEREGKEGKGWEIKFTYMSGRGEEPVGTLKKALDRHAGHIMTRAGLIFLKGMRFKWLERLPKGRIRKDGTSVFLTTLEWIRLRIDEEEIVIRITGRRSRAVRKRLEALDRVEPEEKLDLSALRSVLRPYQDTGVRWLKFLHSYGLSGLLCDDMGLGKTHQAMALLASVHATGAGKKFFVVCPTSVIYHWEDLLKRFLPSFKVVVFFGTGRKLSTFAEGNADLLLTSYGVLRSEKEALSKIEFDVAVLDEMQIAKNVQSRTHQALVKIRAKMKVGLTGTPIENRLTEIKSLFDVILPGYLPSQAEYGETFVVPIEKYRDEGKRIRLQKIIHPFVLRRKKSEVLEDLPDKFEELAFCDLSDEQKKLYDQAYLRSHGTLTEELESGNRTSRMHLFALLNKLKQICNHPALFLDDTENYAKYTSGKWDLFVELVQEARLSGQKLVVFTQYLGMMKIIGHYFTENGIGFAAIQGATKNRRMQLEKFRDNPSCEVFVASLKAAGTGIDLTSASVVIHYDRWWNPAKENQATDRVHRIGQNRGVQVFKMVTKHSVEEHIHALILKKKELLEGVVGYDDREQVKRLSREDLLVLLQAIGKDVTD